MKTLADDFREIRRVGTPWCVVQSSDYRATIRELLTVLLPGEVEPPAYVWNCVNGPQLVRGRGDELGVADDPPSAILKNALQLPEQSILFFVVPDDFAQPNHFWTNPYTIQAAANLRDSFKTDRRTLVILSIDGKLPSLIADDVPVLRDPLPTKEELFAIAEKTIESAGVKVPKPNLDKGVSLCLGMNRFAAEEAIARKLSRKGLDITGLSTAQREVIEQSSEKALTFERGSETFEDIGGLDQVKKFAKRLFSGERPPTVIVRIEEIEKAMAGAGSGFGDSTGVSQDQLGVLLTAMEDNDWSGLISVGMAGCLHGDTIIHDPVDNSRMTVRMRCESGGAFHVWSRKQSGEPCVAVAMPPQRYKPAEMIRFTFQDGRQLTVTEAHRFWDGHDYVAASVVFSRLQEFGACHLPTIWEHDLLNQTQGVLHSTRTIAGSPDRCSVDCHLCGELLPLRLNTSRFLSQQQGDARKRNHFLLRTDDRGGVCASSHHSKRDRHSMTGCIYRIELHLAGEFQLQSTEGHREHETDYSPFVWRLPLTALLWRIGSWLRQSLLASRPTCSLEMDGLCSRRILGEAGKHATEKCHVFSQWQNGSFLTNNRQIFDDEIQELLLVDAGCNPGISRAALQDSFLESCTCRKVAFAKDRCCSPLQSQATTGEVQEADFSLQSPFYRVKNRDADGNHIGLMIVNAERVGRHEYYDFHVPEFENYWANGVYHHNSGKSLLSKAMGNTYKVPTVNFDLGACKGQYVGTSEGKIRKAMSILKSFADNGAFFVATSNGLNVIPPELKRRFRFGTWFMDLPNFAERERIWSINLTRFNLDAKSQRPDDADWVGSDIRNVCDLASRLKCSLIEAAEFIVPVAKSDPGAVTRLRESAHGKFLSATTPGPYRKPEQREGRTINI